MTEFEINWRVHVCESAATPRPKPGGALPQTNNQALCGSVGARNMTATMIELLSAWYSHE